MKNCRLISITGPSGTGKTTISNIISCIFEDSIIISGDDSHRWERGNDNWKRFTHLNPAANNIKNDEAQIRSLRNGRPISRSVYNHDTGLFEDPVEISPVQTIVYEGLHTLYTSNLRSMADIRIYIDTPETLKKGWKIHRDTNSRGYTRDQVAKAIEKRKPDEQKYILPQREFADFIIHINKSENGSIKLSFTNRTQKNFDLIKKIEQVYDGILSFVEYSNKVGKNSNLIEKTGGNISLKVGNKIIISSSGISLNDVGFFKNFCICSVKNPAQQIFVCGRPSMELGAHLHLNKCTIHTHPSDLLAILCTTNSKNILEFLYSEYSYSFFNYTAPGAATASKLANVVSQEVVFFQNHGVFVTSNSFEKSYRITKEISELARLFLKSKKVITSNDKTTHPLFPDAAVMAEANKEVNNGVYRKIIESNLQPKFLTNEESEELINLEEEKYRMKMEKK